MSPSSRSASRPLPAASSGLVYASGCANTDWPRAACARPCRLITPPGSRSRSASSMLLAAVSPRVVAVAAARSKRSAARGAPRAHEAASPRASAAQPDESRSGVESRPWMASDRPRSDSSAPPSAVITTVPGCTEPCVIPAACSATRVWAVSASTDAAPLASTDPAASRPARVGVTACAVSSHTWDPAATTSATGMRPGSPPMASLRSVSTAATTRSRTPGASMILASNSSAPARRPSGEIASIQLPTSVIQVCSVNWNPAMPFLGLVIDDAPGQLSASCGAVPPCDVSPPV